MGQVGAFYLKEGRQTLYFVDAPKKVPGDFLLSFVSNVRGADS